MKDQIKLLIVDDEVKFLETIARRLEMRGFEVTTAVNGDDALAIAEQEKFDLALVDLKMPGMDGDEVLARLKANHKFLEVIILTGHGSLNSAVECTKLGAFGYLPKPHEIDKLTETLKEAYQARLNKKFAANQRRLDEIRKIATGDSSLDILRRLREFDDGQR